MILKLCGMKSIARKNIFRLLYCCFFLVVSYGIIIYAYSTKSMHSSPKDFTKTQALSGNKPVKLVNHDDDNSRQFKTIQDDDHQLSRNYSTIVAHNKKKDGADKLPLASRFSSFSNKKSGLVQSTTELGNGDEQPRKDNRNIHTTNSASTVIEASPLRQKDQRNRKYILYWRPPWGIISEGPREGMDINGKCVITYNRSKIKDAEAIIFHYTSLDEETMPWKHYRDRNQLFVYANHESPAFIRSRERRQDFRKFDENFINMTMSYRFDSSIPHLYHYILNKELSHKILSGQGKVWTEFHLKRKKKLVLWLVSNCNLTYGAVQRLKYVDDLVAAGLQIDRYGSCFKNSEAFSKLPVKILQSYKFYLAFENALHCKDYLTEKFWFNALSQGRVPIVWGPSKEDVTRLAPKHSFIHAEDFDSPANLAAYIQYLDKNDTAYGEYFQWIENPDEKSLEIVKFHLQHWGQTLCELISLPERKQSIINSITSFYKNETNLCFYSLVQTHESKD